MVLFTRVVDSKAGSEDHVLSVPRQWRDCKSSSRHTGAMDMYAGRMGIVAMASGALAANLRAQRARGVALQERAVFAACLRTWSDNV